MSETLLSNDFVKSRDIKYDLLKTLGILLIILAHVIPVNTLLFQIRNFDVPLMLIISGILFYKTTKKQNASYIGYLKKRLPRLIAPVWVFLIFFFIAVYLINLLLKIPYPYSFNIIIQTFFLKVGIPYIWIVRVFTCIALVSPLILNLYLKIKNIYGFILIMFSAFLINEFLFKSLLKIPLDIPIFDLIPWLFTFSLGLILPQLSRKMLLLGSLCFFSIFLFLAVYFYHLTGHYVSTQNYKYPPQLYYLSYGISISLFLLAIINSLPESIVRFLNSKNKFTDSIVFISSSTLWIFLWHIFFLEYQSLWGRIFPSLSHYLIKYVVIVSLAIFFTYIQKKMVAKFISNSDFKPIYSDWLTIIFLK